MHANISLWQGILNKESYGMLFNQKYIIEIISNV